LQAARNDKDPDVVAHRLAEGEEAAEFIRTCIVQTRKTESGDFGAPHASIEYMTWCKMQSWGAMLAAVIMCLGGHVHCPAVILLQQAQG
jgi:hypothetical protein